MRSSPHGPARQLLRTAVVGATAATLLYGFGVSSASAEGNLAQTRTEASVTTILSPVRTAGQAVTTMLDQLPETIDTQEPRLARSLDVDNSSISRSTASAESRSIAAQPPRVSSCWVRFPVPGICVKFSLQATYDINHLVQQAPNPGRMAAVLCRYIPHPLAKGVCVVLVKWKFGEVKRSMQEIADRQMCAELRLAHAGASALLSRVTAARC